MKLSLKMNVTATSIEAAAVGRYSSQTFQRHNGENHARGMLKMIFWCLQQNTFRPNCINLLRLGTRKCVMGEEILL